MNVPDFVKDLPITLANWHSSTAHSVPITSTRSRTISEYDYLDAGGSGILLHRTDQETFKFFKLKRDSLIGSPFYPRCFALPLITGDQNRSDTSPSSSLSHPSHSNSLLFDDTLGCFFYADMVTNNITLHKLEHGVNHPSQTSIHRVSSEKSVCKLPIKKGPICEISRSFTYSGSEPMTIVRQPQSISMIKLGEDGDQVSLTPNRVNFIKKSKGISNQKSNESTLFWKVSKSVLMENSIAVGQFCDKDHIKISDYDLETNQFLWCCDSTESNGCDKLTWKKPISVFWLQDHPKLLAYCEQDQFALLDTREQSTKSSTSIMDRSQLKYVREWEKFRDVCPLSITDSQFLLSLDHKVILVDRRFPQKNLLQWNHMLPCNVNSSLHFLSSTSMDNVGSLISLANKDQACLMTVNHFDINIIQTQSLHFPMHLSQPVDSWYLSSHFDPQVRRRLENILLTGLIVIPGENHYSVCQSTHNGDLWVQSFYPTESIPSEQRVSWKRNCLLENLPIDESIEDLLDNVFSKWSSQLPEQDPDEKLSSNRKRPFPESIKANEPNFIMPIPGSSDYLQSSRDQSNGMNGDCEFESTVNTGMGENFFNKRLHLLIDEPESLTENRYSLKLLSKWRYIEEERDTLPAMEEEIETLPAIEDS